MRQVKLMLLGVGLMALVGCRAGVGVHLGWVPHYHVVPEVQQPTLAPMQPELHSERQPVSADGWRPAERSILVPPRNGQLLEELPAPPVQQPSGLQLNGPDQALVPEVMLGEPVILHSQEGEQLQRFRIPAHREQEEEVQPGAEPARQKGDRAPRGIFRQPEDRVA